MAADGVLVTQNGEVASPLHIQRVENALSLDRLLTYIDDLGRRNQQSDIETSTDAETDVDQQHDSHLDQQGNKLHNGIVTTKAERRADKARLYNFSKVKKGRKWLKNVLLSDSSSDEEDDGSLSREQLRSMLRLHKLQKQYNKQFHADKELSQYQYYSVGLLSNYDKFYEHQKSVVPRPKRKFRDANKPDKRNKIKHPRRLKKGAGEIGDSEDFERKPHPAAHQTKPQKIKKLTPEQIAIKRRRIWISISKKEVPKAQKQKASARKEMFTMLRKVAVQCMKEHRRAAMQSQRIMKETPMRARRLSKEMLVYWKRFEKVEKEHRKRAEKEAQEQRKMDLEISEMKRQQRKLNFLITQTELYAHFMSRKLTGETNKERDQILSHLEEGGKSSKAQEVKGGVLEDTRGDGYNPNEMKALALKNAEAAYQQHTAKQNAFGKSSQNPLAASTNESTFANPTSNMKADRKQPSIFQGTLKGYQLKGMNWLADLYDQGINGILADEMGLGKTVQSIAVLTHLAEAQDLWGPFLIIAPASTLHNWQQELSRFVSKFKVVPYWGNTQDRKIMRKFWNQDSMTTEDASFHVVVTSYQLVIQDVKYFQRIKWQYMILDEAQAIKSTSSVRWKILLGFNCRNRLLLTGTPIQNSMAELWALLHFIMPTLFDSHDEFNEWFSKDIESHVEKQSGIDENQLSRLHMILKPFMLRRVKKDVENELSDKIEILVYCPLTIRQRTLYQAIKNKISIEDLLQSASSNSASSSQTSTSSLMNLVMQFRKVCNHPELFERREARSPLFFKLVPYLIPKLIFREGELAKAMPSMDHLLYNKLSPHNPQNIHQSLTDDTFTGSTNSCYSFLRFVDMSPQEFNQTMFQGLLFRWLNIVSWLRRRSQQLSHRSLWREPDKNKKYLSRSDLLLAPTFTMSSASVAASFHLRKFIFVSTQPTFYAHLNHTVHYIPETLSHRKIRCKQLLLQMALQPKKSMTSPPTSPTGQKSTPLSPNSKAALAAKKLLQAEKVQIDVASLPAHRHLLRPSREFKCQPTSLPTFLDYNVPKVCARWPETYSNDRSAQWESMSAKLCGTLKAKKTLLYGSAETAEYVKWKRFYFHPEPPEGIYGQVTRHGYSGVFIPDKETLVTDAGKLYVLDSLLGRLKAEGHRVLIYSQMTRMIDILEEYMWHRKHTYMRLDGSSKISDRRDMVADFQSRQDIFVFLLSTRAGGLGINLTAADTVIFYDSDWNPTVDQQAMDRAHRLGQTKQVTVYRLVCKGSIEERILQRAKEKSEIQRMVISGGSFRPDVLKPKEVVSLLLDDDEMEKKLRQKVDERRNKDEINKEKDRKRKREKYAEKTGTPPTGPRRGPGRPRKIRPPEEVNVTIPAPPSDLSDSRLSFDSFTESNTASPMSVGGTNPGGADDSSNEALVIVDDNAAQPGAFASVTPPPPPPAPKTSTKRGTGRPRGRPRGSGVGRRPRGRGSVQKAIAAAEMAAAQAGKSNAYAAYGYSFTGRGMPAGARGSGRGQPSGTGAPGGSGPTEPTGRGTPGFYSQRNITS